MIENNRKDFIENNIIKKLDAYIMANLENPNFATDDILKEIAISRSQLYRLIKDNYNLSISLYIRQKKLAYAKKLLEKTDLKISEITYKIGFDSPQSFSKFFTLQYNISPTEYRKSHILVNEKVIVQPAPFEKPSNNINPKTGPSNKYYWVIISFILLILAAVFYWWQSNKKAGFKNYTETQNVEKSIAILPFKNLGNANTSYFSEGIMEQIHNMIASLSELKVISSNSTKKYTNTQKNSQQIGNELHVNYILGGSVLQLQNQVRITMELVQVTDNRVIWAKNFEGDSENIFEYMSSIATEVTKALNQKLSVTQQSKIEKIPTHNLAAYNEFLQGQQLLNLRTMDKMEASIVKFDNAIKLDPNFADAYANKAIAYFVIGNNQLNEAETSYKFAEKNALMAIKLDPDNGKAYAVLAQNYAEHNKWEQAITTSNIALKLSPNDAQINYWFSLTVRSIGQMDEAIKYSSKAIVLDPLAPHVYGGHIINCAYAGEFEMAEKAIKTGELFFKDAALFHYAKGFYYINRKDFNNALVSFQRSDALDSTDYYNKSLITYCKGMLGDDTAVNNFIKTVPLLPESHKYFAIVYAGIQNKDLCLKHLELAAKINSSPYYLKVSPLFKFLQGEPRFEAVLSKLGLINVTYNIE